MGAGNKDNNESRKTGKYFALAQKYFGLGDFDKAVEYYKKTLDILWNNKAIDELEIAKIYNNLGIKKVKSPVYIKEYFADPEFLVESIRKYNHVHKQKKHEASLYDLIKPK